jgi:spore germination protein GerM
VTRRGALPAVVALVALGGCGIEPQSTPEDISVAPVPTASARPDDEFSAARIQLWFLRGERLAVVVRGAPNEDPAVALEMLAAGPDRDEIGAGLTTAVTGDPPTVADDDADDGVLTLEVAPEFVAVPDDQRRAIAQVVFTVTGLPDVEFVRFTIDDDPLEVPTDEGLSDQPVDRSDFDSMAPPEPAGGPNPD